jgi:ribosomal protein S18 acetylase RimI-like enzyme
MRQSPELLAAHQARRDAIDPLLAPSVQPFPEPGERDAILTCPGGVAYVRNQAVDPDSWGYTFSPAHESRLAPKVDGPRAFAELVDLWAAREEFRPGPDSVATITWPSRDTEMTRALVERGFAPQSVLAVRLAGRPVADHPARDVVIRRALPPDTSALTRLWMELLRWDEQFGHLSVRPSTPAGLAAQVAQAVGGEEKRAWIAERDGAAAGLVVVQPPEHAQWAARAIRASPVAYLNAGMVSNAERGSGVGAALVRQVHAELDAEGVAAVLLHYMVANPLSGPFWARCGYRPLLTTWSRGTVG